MLSTAVIKIMVYNLSIYDILLHLIFYLLLVEPIKNINLIITLTMNCFNGTLDGTPFALNSS